MKLRARTNKKYIFLVIAVVLVVAGAGATLVFLKQQKPAAEQVPTPPKSAAFEPPRLRFAAMGDMLAHDTIVAGAKSGAGYDFAKYFAKIQPLLRDKDVVFCNPETPAAPSFAASGYPTFNAPAELVRDLKKQGCNLINLATNHIYDKGDAGVSGTIEAWEAEQPLAIAGANRSAAEQQKIRYFEKNGIKVAFLAYADFSNAAGHPDYALNLYQDEALLRSQVTEARAEADAVVVSMHWGTEDSNDVNADQTKYAELLAHLGADVAIGTGPHVLQKVAWLDGQDGHKTLVWYSIGNMLSSQLQIDQLTGGVAGFDIVKTSTGVRVDSVGFAPTYMAYDWAPADRAAQNLLARTSPMLYPLNEAGAKIGEMFPGATLEERQSYVRRVLGDDVQIR